VGHWVRAVSDCLKRYRFVTVTCVDLTCKLCKFPLILYIQPQELPKGPTIVNASLYRLPMSCKVAWRRMFCPGQTVTLPLVYLIDLPSTIPWISTHGPLIAIELLHWGQINPLWTLLSCALEYPHNPSIISWNHWCCCPFSVCEHSQTIAAQ